MEILTRRSIVKFTGLLLLRRSGTELRVDHPKTTKIPPNHRDFNGLSAEFCQPVCFGATKSKNKITV
jgi:hypothetical protein